MITDRASGFGFTAASRWRMGASVHKFSKRDQNAPQWMSLVRFPWAWRSKVAQFQ
jgi:UDP-N-acetyl-D-mannosaminuronic acid transferase (WecB/TagA/CpsF family)